MGKVKGLYKHAKTPEHYLEQRYAIIGDCWIWQGGKDKDGYGQCQSSRWGEELGVSRSHQMAYLTWVGSNPYHLCVCHTCDTPSCINPEHLFLGTVAENNQDKINKGRHIIERKPRDDLADILACWPDKTCLEVAEIFGMSYSNVCMIWRANGLTIKKKKEAKYARKLQKIQG